MNPPLCFNLSLLFAVVLTCILIGFIIGIGVMNDRSKEGKKKLFYIAGPLTTGNTIENVRKAAQYGAWVMHVGHAAYVPHISILWDWIEPQGYEDWMELDFEIIRRCDAIIRLPGECPGCEREVELALEIGIPVFYDPQIAVRWANGWEPDWANEEEVLT